MDPSTSAAKKPMDADELMRSLNEATPPDTWSEWFSFVAMKFMLYVAKDPWGFFLSLLLFLTPLMMVSGYLAYRLGKELEKGQKDDRKRAKRMAAIAKATKKQEKND